MKNILTSVLTALVVSALMTLLLVSLTASTPKTTLGALASGITGLHGLQISGNPGSLTVSTSNTATSTTALGCVQLYATSTATAVHLEFSTSTTNAAYGTRKAGSAVAWRYGKCPI